MGLKNLSHMVGDENKQETGTVRWFYRSIPFVLLFLFWEILARLIHNSLILPPFSAVAVNAFSPPLAYHLASTLTFSLLGLLIISLVGLPLGMPHSGGCADFWLW
jgi:ABC-type nitrate/sulfonate/bicarbonate transport system permease component